MAFNPELPLSKVSELRLEVGDIHPDTPYMDDAVYQHLLNKHSNNIKRAGLDAAKSLLFYLNNFTRERTGQIEVYGDAIASNYRKALELYIKNPNLNAINAVPYAGGISKADMQANVDNSDNIGVTQLAETPCQRGKVFLNSSTTANTFTF